MTSIKWIKLNVDMFDDEKIKIIQAMPEGDALLIVWIKLITLAGKTNEGGYVYISNNMPYSEDMLSIIMNKPISIIRLALNTFQSLGMIENDENGIYLVNFDKYQSLDRMQEIREYNRLAQRKHREKLKCQKMSLTSKSCHETDIDKDIDIDIDINNNINNKELTSEIFDIYQNEIGSLSSRQYEKLNQYRKDLSDDLIKEAIHIASDNNAKTFKYIETILIDWKNKGYKVIGNIKKVIKEDDILTDEFNDIEDFNWLED